MSRGHFDGHEPASYNLTQPATRCPTSPARSPTLDDHVWGPSCEQHGRGEWAAGSEEHWFTGQACSFTREISRATINTTVSFKGAVYHTAGFEGPQTNLGFFSSPPPPTPLSLNVQLHGGLNTIKCEFPLLHYKWLLIVWPDIKKALCCPLRNKELPVHLTRPYIINVPSSLGVFLCLCCSSEQRAQICQEPFQVNGTDFQWAPPVSKTFIPLNLMYCDLKWGLMIHFRKRPHKTYSAVKVTQPCSMCSINL